MHRRQDHPFLIVTSTYFRGLCDKAETHVPFKLNYCKCIGIFVLWYAKRKISELEKRVKRGLLILGNEYYPEKGAFKTCNEYSDEHTVIPLVSVSLFLNLLGQTTRPKPIWEFPILLDQEILLSLLLAKKKKKKNYRKIRRWDYPEVASRGPRHSKLCGASSFQSFDLPTKKMNNCTDDPTIQKGSEDALPPQGGRKNSLATSALCCSLLARYIDFINNCQTFHSPVQVVCIHCCHCSQWQKGIHYGTIL